jgi:hypothetical protein
LAIIAVDHHPEPAGIADARDRRGLHHQDEPLFDAGKPLQQLAGDPCSRSFRITAAIRPIIEDQKYGA